MNTADEIEKILQQMTEGMSKPRRKYDWDAVWNYVCKQNRPVTVSEVKKHFGIQYNIVRGYFERHLVDVKTAKQRIANGQLDKPAFIKFNGVYVPLPVLANALQK